MNHKVAESLAGTVERITFHNPENGFCVLKLKVKGRKGHIALVGHATSVSPGEFVQASGTWLNDKTYGPQFKAETLEIKPPSTKQAIEKYLSSGMINGIGPHSAKNLVEIFGTDILDVIANNPQKLLTVAGIGKHRTKMITQSWHNQKAIREIMIFLHQYGIGTSMAVKIHKKFGASAIHIISQNPYCLVSEVPGIGFEAADSIAMKLGMDTNAPARACAGVSYALNCALSEGHCGLPHHELLKAAESLLGIPVDEIEIALEQEITMGVVVADKIAEVDFIFPAPLYRLEKQIASLLRRQIQGSPPWTATNPEKVIPWVENKLGITLAPSQQAAVKLALESKVMVITGGPGVGKTTILNSILTILDTQKVKCCLCAPTGRAAKRLSESTGHEAKTIHRLLEINPETGQFRRDSLNELKCDFLIVDELSMVDVSLMHALLKALPAKAALIMVGDADQLPSIGPGQVLADIINSKAVPTVRLTEVFRQAASSQIITNSHRINQGMMPENTPDSDFYFIECDDPDKGIQTLLRVILERIPKKFALDSVQDVQVLSPMNRGKLGVQSLNIELQKRLNPDAKQKIERFGNTFWLDDKVMQIENDYEKEVYNGDIGFVSEINEDEENMLVEFDNRAVVYDFSELDKLTLAYAITIHKAQGSEYPAIVMPLFTQHYLMLRQNLLYTGITRGKQLVVVIGQKKALSIAISDQQTKHRWSKLSEWLMA